MRRLLDRRVYFCTVASIFLGAQLTWAQVDDWTKTMSAAAAAAGAKQQAQAMELYEKALAAARKFGETDPRLDKTLVSVERYYESQKNWTKAELICRQMLAVREKSMGVEHLGYAQTLNNLGVVLTMESKFPEAEQDFAKALKIVETNMGLENRYVAMILENYGPLLRKMNRSADADKMDKRLRDIQSAERATIAAATPAESVSAAGVIASSSAGRRHGVVDDDEPRPAAAVAQAPPAQASPRFFDQDVNEMLAMSNLYNQYEQTASSYKDKGDLKHAEKLYKMSLEAAQLSSGPRSMETVLATGSLAMCYKDEGKFALAEPLFRRQVSVYAHMADLDPWRLELYAHEYYDILRVVGKNSLAAQVNEYRKHVEDWISDPESRNAGYCAWLLEDKPQESISFASYKEDLIKKIREHASLPPGEAAAPPVVVFTISKDGSISHLEMLHTSESLSVDQAALRAVAQAAPFPALPPDTNFDVRVEYNFDGQGSATIHHQ